MPNLVDKVQHQDLEKHTRQMQNNLIREQLLHTLGKPDKLLKVQVQSLWENFYRVNILVGDDITRAKISNSYFLKADGDGNIVESTPRIVKNG
jgi:hypothetical protein